MQKAIVVGGGVQHVSVVKILQEYGFYVILVDFFPDPPAKKVVNKHIIANGFDADVLYQIAKKESVSIIVNICYDLAMPAVAYVSEKLNLPAPFTFEQSLDYTDKMRMKAIFRAHGIPSSNYIIVDDTSCDISELCFPVVVKPIDSSGSRGISKANNIMECKLAIELALLHSKKKKALVEEFLVGEEYQIDCIVNDGEAAVVLSKQKLRFECLDVVSPAGSLIVPDAENSLIDQELSLANQLSNAFEIKNGVFFFQCILHRGVLKMIELGVRIGAGFSYRMVKDIKGVDLARVAVESWVSKKSDITIMENKTNYLTNAIFARQSCVLERIDGFDVMQGCKMIDSYDVYFKPGHVVDGRMTNKNRLALYMLHSPSKQELKSLFNQIISRISVIDISGRNVFDNRYYESWINRVIK